MPIVLFRVDERLIHGQVVVGWGGPLHIGRMIVVDDDLAQSDWEQELYTLGVPDDMAAEFATVEDARARLGAWDSSADRVMVLVRDVPTLRRIAEGGALRGRQVTLGGIHHSAGRRKVLPYLFLNDEEQRSLQVVADDGVNITAQDLPASRSVPLAQLLDA
jgi:mannose/fructose/N-acetylgalactosamine-specific phosphotransferase system component IIB